MREGWKRATLGSLTEKVTRRTPARDEELQYIDISSVSRDTKTISGTVSVNGETAPGRARQLVQAGDVLVSTVRPNLNAVARVPAYFPNAIASTGFSVLRERSDVAPGYLFAVARSAKFVEDMTARSTGSNYPAVTDRIVREYEIDLPPLEEQQRIVDLIGSLDDAIEAADAAAAVSHRAAVALIRELLSGETRLNGHSEAWTSGSLSDVGEFLNNQRKPITAKDRKPGTTPYYGANGVQGYVEGHIFDEPLVLLAEDGGRYDVPGASVAYGIDGKSWVNNHAHVIRARPDVATTEFVLLAANFADYSGIFAGSTRTKLTKGGATSVPVKIPPIEEQRAITDVTSPIQKASELASAFAATLRTARTELLTVLLSGDHEIPESYDVDTAAQLETAA